MSAYHMNMHVPFSVQVLELWADLDMHPFLRGLVEVEVSAPAPRDLQQVLHQLVIHLHHWHADPRVLAPHFGIFHVLLYNSNREWR